MPRTIRSISREILWYGHGRCFRFAYRDPHTEERRFLMCTPERFRQAGIALPSDQVVRRDTKVGRGLAEQLQGDFLKSLDAVVTESAIETVPKLSTAIDNYFELFDQSGGYRKTLRSIFERFQSLVGDRRVDLIRDTDLKRFEKKIAKDCTRTTVRSYMKQLYMLINFCFRKGWIRQDPRLTYRLPKEQLKDPNPMSMKEVAAFFEACRSADFGKGWGHIEWIGLGLLTLGLRPVELIHARWENINWEERTLWIDKSHGAKEAQARQHQPIPLAVWGEFEERRQESGPIWTGARGGPLTPSGMNRFRDTVAKKIDGFMWKRFRKTYATILAEAGNDVIVVSRLLRHSLGGKTMSIAQRHYVGQDMRRLREVVDGAFAGLAGVMPVREIKDRPATKTA